MRASAHLRWLAAAMTLLAASGVLGQPQKTSRVPWKPVAFALLRVDDAAPKIWQVYRSDKRKQFILVQIGARFLLADLQNRRVYELAADSLTRVKDTLEWADPGDPPATPSAPGDPTAAAPSAKLLLPSSDWSMRDVGPAMRIRFRLTGEGREFDVQFPIQPDLRQFY